MPKDPYQIKKLLNTKNGTFTYYSLAELEKQGHDINKLPFSIRILLENALRNFDDFAVTKENIETAVNLGIRSHLLLSSERIEDLGF